MSPTSYLTAPPRVVADILFSSFALAFQVDMAERRPQAQAMAARLGSAPMRVAAVDIGSNSTRLLVADVVDQRSIRELLRESRVTRLGEGVDATGELSEQAIARTLTVLADYRALIDRHRCASNRAVLTSAVRDARNGAEFSERVRRQFDLDARTLSGDQEARLTFLGAMSAQRRAPSHAPACVQPPRAPARAKSQESQKESQSAIAVIDIGGGSTEIVIGSNEQPSFHTSLQIGVVRMSERHIRHDPPLQAELASLRADVRAILNDGLPEAERAATRAAIAVAGTATSAASIDQQLDPYDPARVEGYRLSRARIEEIGDRLARIGESERRQVKGLHPDRAPTIVAGMAILSECLAGFGLEEVEVSEHDILYGAALSLAAEQAGIANRRP
jgi:exopolyphosphatase/guanosine-5'-triphosphate,3'-diphosphate pyrophosphatase